jgi:hypothetical protein
LNLNIDDRLEVIYQPDAAEVEQAIEEWKSYIMAETLCDNLVVGPVSGDAKQVSLGKVTLRLALRKK